MFTYKGYYSHLGNLIRSKIFIWSLLRIKMDYEINGGYGGAGRYKMFDKNYSEDFSGKYRAKSLYDLDMTFKAGYKDDKSSEYMGH